MLHFIKEASFVNSNASVEDIEYLSDRRLDKGLILKLASGTYIHHAHNIILKGSTGSGKTFLDSAFGI